MKKHPRPGSKFYKDVLVPINAKICIDKNGFEFYISATNQTHSTVVYIDQDKPDVKVKNEIISKYF